MSKFLAGLLTALAFAGAPALADPRKDAAAPATGVRPESGLKPLLAEPVSCSGVERRFVLLTPQVVVGEPVLLRLALKNPKPGEQAEFVSRVAFGADIKLRVFPPPGRPAYEFRGADLGSLVPNVAVDMANHGTFRLDFRMAMDRESVTGAAFDEPGKYRIQMLANCVHRDKPPTPIDLGSLDLEVLPAQGDDLKALAFLSDYQMFEAFQHRLGWQPGRRTALPEATVKALRRLVDEAPAARLRPHALLILADFEEFTDRPEESLKLLQRVQVEYPRTPFADDALMAELRLRVALRELEPATRLFTRVWTDPYLTTLITPSSNLWEDFVKPFLPTTTGTQWMLYNEVGPDPERGEVPQGPTLKFAEDAVEPVPQ